MILWLAFYLPNDEGRFEVLGVYPYSNAAHDAAVRYGEDRGVPPDRVGIISVILGADDWRGERPEDEDGVLA